MRVERYSYPCPTPSAARGALESFYFKPRFYWQVTRIAYQKLEADGLEGLLGRYCNERP